jgi:beta-mannanase
MDHPKYRIPTYPAIAPAQRHRIVPWVGAFLRRAAAGLIAAALAHGAAAASSPAAWKIGAYLANPNPTDAGAAATYAANYQGFSQAMGLAPMLIDVYVDYTQPVSSWVANASYQAWCNAQTPDAKALIPVIGFPMASLASGSASADAQFQAFAAGTYDSVITGVVQAWVAQGFKDLKFRVGWEMNIEGNTYAGDSAQSQADWVAAFKHIYLVMHEAANAAGVSLQVAWNPNVTNYTNAEATTNLYPGDGYVDIVAADMYANMYPFSDSSGAPTYHDWVSGGEDTTLAQFIAKPGNRSHYWSYPAATKWSLDSSGGHSQSLTSLLQFALAHHKPFALPEVGAGDSQSGHDVSDDPTFPQWLAAQLQAAQQAGLTIYFVNIWDVNADGNYQFSTAADGKPQEAAAWKAAIAAISYPNAP